MLAGFSLTARAAAAGVTAAGLLIGAFALGLGQAGGATTTAGGPGTSPVLAGAAAPAAGARITVTGTGTVTGTPDQLLLSMGVQTSGPSVSTALASANRSVRAVTMALRRGGVAAADIQTSGLFIEPDYAGGPGAPSGYGVSESVQVTLRHLATAGSLISDAARAGGNATVVDGVSLSLPGSSSLLAAARAKAVADAHARASQYARALGRPLGPVVSMSESPPPGPFFGAAGSAAASAGSARSAPVPVHPGTQQLTVTVTVVFALA
jgi:uncharacterized protein